MKTVDLDIYKQFAQQRLKCVACDTLLDPNSEPWAVDTYFRALTCPNCEMVQVEPCLSDIGLSQFYDGYYMQRVNKTALGKKRILQYQQDVVYITRFLNSGSILDIGCSDGSFLSYFPSTFKKSGIDIELDTTVKQTSSLNLKSGYFPTSNEFHSEFFDLVTFRGVIEHLRDPAAFISKAVAHLKCTGYIYICATPNLHSPSAYNYRTRWNQWHPIEHPNLFCLSSLRTLFERFGLQLVDANYPYLHTPYASFESDLQQYHLGLEPNSVDISPPFWGTMLSAVFSFSGK